MSMICILIDVIKYYLLPNFVELKLYYKKYKHAAVQNKYSSYKFQSDDCVIQMKLEATDVKRT